MVRFFLFSYCLFIQIHNFIGHICSLFIIFLFIRIRRFPLTLVSLIYIFFRLSITINFCSTTSILSLWTLSILYHQSTTLLRNLIFVGVFSFQSLNQSMPHVQHIISVNINFYNKNQYLLICRILYSMLRFELC